MKMGRIFLLSITVGCGGVNSQPDAGAMPADTAANVPAMCDLTKPFGPPTVVPNINSTARDEYAVIADDLTIYWASDRPGGAGSMDLYLATRSSPTGSFMNPTPITSVNSAGTEQTPSLTGDELTMYYTFAAVVGGSADIYATKRTSVASAFPLGTAVAQINLTSDDGDQFVTADGGILYFASSRPGGVGSYDIYRAIRRNDGSFDLPQPVSELNTANLEGHPVLTANGLVIYWNSNRTDGAAQGREDIWTATRPSTSEPFGNPAAVRELNSVFSDAPTWITPDGCRIYLSTDRPGGPGSSDIWTAVKPM